MMTTDALSEQLYRLTSTRAPALPADPLARARQLMAALDNPQLAYPTVHITGTKGKGSVAAMTAAMLGASGYRVGLYTSPHLQDLRERFRIQDELISVEGLASLLVEAQPTLAAFTAQGLTWFEAVTALVFSYFRQQAVDIAVIEVGIGGRFDATNVVVPLATAITSLSYDHMALLGSTLAEIASAKAGIIKAGVPVLSAPQPPEALAVISESAAAQHAPLILVGRDWHYQALGGDLHYEYFLAGPANAQPQPYRTRLLGQHQALNATVALALVDSLAGAGFPVNLAAQQAGLAQVLLPGRLEIIAQEPLCVLDAAHNGDSAARLAQALAERFPQKPRVLVFGAKIDKDIAGMFAALLPLADALVLTQAADVRAAPSQELAALARQQGYNGPIHGADDAPAAIQQAVALAGQQGMILVTGSLYLVGEVRTLYNRVVKQEQILDEMARTDVGT